MCLAIGTIRVGFFSTYTMQVELFDTLQRKMVRRIVGWRCIDGEPWGETMRIMSDRVEITRHLYDWQYWSQRFFP